MKNIIQKYSEFINENLHDTPEQYVSGALTKIKTKLEKMFSNSDTAEGGEIKKISETPKDGNVSFSDLGLELQSIELSKYSKTLKNVKVIFSDPDSRYDATFSINLKDAVPEDADKDFSDNEIKKCFVRFKKYDLEGDMNLVGEITRTVKIDDINEDLIMDLKIELDDEYGSNEEEFQIETE